MMDVTYTVQFTGFADGAAAVLEKMFVDEIAYFPKRLAVVVLGEPPVGMGLVVVVPLTGTFGIAVFTSADAPVILELPLGMTIDKDHVRTAFVAAAGVLAA